MELSQLDQDDWSDDPTMWSAQEQPQQKCTLFILPSVSICFKARRGSLYLGLKTSEPVNIHHHYLTPSSDSSSDFGGSDDNGGIASETKTVKILLDNVLVAEKQGAESLMFKKPLVELECGRHHVQYIAMFDSGDVLMYHRVLVYNGPTARDLGSMGDKHVLRSSGSGVLSPGRPVAMWKLADGLMPCAVTLRSPSKAPILLKSARCTVELTNGEATLTEFGDDRVFTVESRACSEAPYDMCVGPLPESPRLLRWDGAARNVALVVGTAQPAHVGTAQIGDSDAVAWINLLQRMRYETRLLGSASCSYSPHVPVGYATRSNVETCLDVGIPAVLCDESVVVIVWTGDDLACADGDHLPMDRLVKSVLHVLSLGARVAMFFDACRISELADMMTGRHGWFIASADSDYGATVTPGAFHHSFLTRGFGGDDLSISVGNAFERTLHAYRYARTGMAQIRCEGDPSIVLCCNDE